jgi:hypothetical protein
MGAVLAAVGILIFRHLEGTAKFFRSSAGPLHADKVAGRIYTARNLRWGAGSLIAIGLLIVLTGVLGIIGVLH